jgi:hypothetical protein
MVLLSILRERQTCVLISAAYGGQRCYNGANVQDELNMIGTAILGLTTVISFIGVFKG